MHSVQNDSLCMYIVILLCVCVYIYIYIYFKIKKKNQQWDTWRTYGHVPKFHVAK
jgi:cytochrome c oxidase assembly factor CtaG